MSQVVLPRGEPKRIEVGKCVYLDPLRTFEVNRIEFGDPRLLISQLDHLSTEASADGIRIVSFENIALEAPNFSFFEYIPYIYAFLREEFQWVVYEWLWYALNYLSQP